jgi:hypothetical protein
MLDSYGLLIGNGIGVTGLLVWLFWMLATGRLATARELAEKDKRIDALSKALEQRDGQLTEALKHLTAENSLMAALHRRADEVNPQ